MGRVDEDEGRWLHLVHRAHGLVIFVVVEAADTAHLIAIVRVVAGIVHILLGSVFGDVLYTRTHTTVSQALNLRTEKSLKA